MADIYVQSFYTQKVLEKGQQGGQGTANFKQTFLACLNRGIGLINAQAKLESPLGIIEDFDENTTLGLDGAWEWVLSDVWDYFYLQTGAREPKDVAIILKRKDEVDREICLYRQSVADAAYAGDSTYITVGRARD